jgi:rubrerythrin
MSSKENLAAAFAGESQANRKYLAFGKKAETDGYKMVSKLFRANAEAETIHAHSHLKAMDGIKDTATNLQTAVDGEGYEFTEMYPKFIEEAKAEGNKAAQRTFEVAMKAEKVHHALYQKALESVKSGKDLDEAEIHICSICGNTVIGGVHGKCEICGVAAEKFIEIK